MSCDTGYGQATTESDESKSLAVFDAVRRLATESSHSAIWAETGTD
ncbi:hypothetical protein [Sinorhizobium fredii]